MSEDRVNTQSNEIHRMPKGKRVYTKPNLEQLGDLRSLTLGPTPGRAESGAPTLFKKKTAGSFPFGGDEEI